MITQTAFVGKGRAGCAFGFWGWGVLILAFAAALILGVLKLRRVV